MLTTELNSAIDRIQRMERLQRDIASGVLPASERVKEHVVYRVQFYRASLRARLAGDYLRALERVRYLTDILGNLGEWGASRDMTFVGALLRKITIARDELEAARLFIVSTSQEGVI